MSARTGTATRIMPAKLKELLCKAADIGGSTLRKSVDVQGFLIGFACVGLGFGVIFGGMPLRLTVAFLMFLYAGYRMSAAARFL